MQHGCQVSDAWDFYDTLGAHEPEAGIVLTDLQ